MSYASIDLESLEIRRMLSASPLQFRIPGTDTTLLVPLFAGGSSSGPITRQGPANGDFSQSPDFTGWQTAGNDMVQAVDFHAIPDAKPTQASLSTAQQPNSGTLPATAANLEGFLGVSAGALSSAAKTAVDGSAIKQSITAKAGDLVTFKADFLTNELPKSNRDYALVSVTFNGKTQYFKITGVLKPTSPLDAAGLSSETGYHSYAILLPRGGQYTIGYAVVNVGDSTVASDLLVDNVQLNTRFGDLFHGDGGIRDGNGNNGHHDSDDDASDRSDPLLA